MRCINKIERFIILVENNALKDSGPIILEFCDFVEHNDVWHLATIVMSPFWHSRLKKEVYPLVLQQKTILDYYIQLQ